MTKFVNDFVLRNAVVTWFDTQPIAQFDVTEIDSVLKSIREILMAEFASLDEVAVRIVREMGTESKIPSIKELRVRTNSGLKEAKEAIERAYAVVLKEKMEAASAEMLRLTRQYQDAAATVNGHSNW